MKLDCSNSARPKSYWLRLIYKGYSYFLARVSETVDKLCNFVQRIDQLTFVYIQVDSHSDAFALFESLNNRGVPSSPIDIIKNKLLVAMEQQHEADVDKSFEKWQKIIDSLSDATEQERFLRHFYNAFKHQPVIRVDGAPRATKSQIIRIYEKLISRNASVLFQKLTSMATLYEELLDPKEKMSQGPIKELVELKHIGASPSYQILLFLFSRPKNQLEPGDFLQKVVSLLCRYYVRRKHHGHASHT